jgi:hypothetical protein
VNCGKRSASSARRYCPAGLRRIPKPSWRPEVPLRANQNSGEPQRSLLVEPFHAAVIASRRWPARARGPLGKGAPRKPAAKIGLRPQRPVFGNLLNWQFICCGSFRRTRGGNRESVGEGRHERSPPAKPKRGNSDDDITVIQQRALHPATRCSQRVDASGFLASRTVRSRAPLIFPANDGRHSLSRLKDIKAKLRLIWYGWLACLGTRTGGHFRYSASAGTNNCVITRDQREVNLLLDVARKPQLAENPEQTKHIHSRFYITRLFGSLPEREKES